MSLSTRRNITKIAKNLYSNVRIGAKGAIKGGGLTSGIVTGVGAIISNPITWIVGFVVAFGIAFLTIFLDPSLLGNPINAIIISVGNIIGLLGLILAFFADMVINLVLFGIVYILNAIVWLFFNGINFVISLFFYFIRFIIFFFYLIFDTVFLGISVVLTSLTSIVNSFVRGIVDLVLNLLTIPFNVFADLVNTLIGVPDGYIPFVHDAGKALRDTLVNTFSDVFMTRVDENTWTYLAVKDRIATGLPLLPENWNLTLGITELYNQIDQQVPNVIFEFNNVQIIEWVKIEIYQSFVQLLRDTGWFPTILERLGLG